jgi:hypothetical protein
METYFMSLIVTQITKYGIIHFSDSNLTSENGKKTEYGKKIFKIEHLKAGLGLAGVYSVNGVSMDTWIELFIEKDKESGNASIREFSNRLKNKLETEMLPDEKTNGCLIHIAGYVSDEDTDHPELWFVRNVHSIDQQTGNYTNIDVTFEISEDYWGRDYKIPEVRNLIELGGYQLYFNGFPAGRIAFLNVTHSLNLLFRQIWGDTQNRFRPPMTLGEYEDFMKTYMLLINALFVSSDYSAPFIGGNIQTFVIPHP